MPGKSLGPSPLEPCIGGYRTYDDNYVSDWGASSIEMKETFTWKYNCQPPTITYKHCWINSIPGSVEHEDCLAEYPNPVYSDVWHGVTFHLAGYPYTTQTYGQERTGYYDGTSGYCTDEGGSC